MSGWGDRSLDDPEEELLLALESAVDVSVEIAGRLDGKARLPVA